MPGWSRAGETYDGAMAADDPQACSHRCGQKIGHRYRAAVDGRVVQLEQRTPASTHDIRVLREKGGSGSFDVTDQIEIAHPDSRQDLAKRESRHSDRGVARFRPMETGGR